MGRDHDESPAALAVLGVLCLLLVLALLGGGSWWFYRRSLAAAEAALAAAEQAEEARRTAAFRALVEGHAPTTRAAVPLPEEPAPESRAATAAPSVPVSGRVVDTDGTPQASVRVRFVQLPRRPGTTVESGPDGGFTLPSPLSTGEWLVFIDQDRQLVRPQAFTLGPQPEAFVEVVVAKEDAKQQIQGRVADPSGRPVAAAEVAAVPESGGDMSRARTRKDGTFVLRRQQDRGTAAGTRLRVAAPGFADHADGTVHPWGTRDLLLTLQRGMDVPIRVVVAGSGEPVERFKLSVVAADAPRREGPDVRPLDGRFPGGLATFTASQLGRHRALVEPEDRMLGLSDWVEFTPGEVSAQPVVVEVPHVVPVRVTVVTSAGAPVAGSRVQVVRQERPDFWRIDTWAGTFARARGGMMLRGQFVWLLTEGVTDGEGKATLRAAPSKVPLGVRALGPGHVPAFVEPLALGPGGADVPVVVEQGATLTGTLTPAAVLAALERFAAAGFPNSRTPPGLRLLRSGDGAVRALPMTGRSTPDGDGRFHWTGIPAGTWTLQLSWDVASPDQTLFTTASAALEVVRELRDGEIRELRCDLSALWPASLRGQVFFDGQPFARGRVTLWSWSGTAGARSRNEVPVRTDGEGRFQVAALRPGAYRLAADARDPVTGRELPIEGREVLTLAPGQAAEHTFQIERLRARLRLLSAIDERPLPNHQFALRDADGSWAQDLVTDAEGQLLLDPLRPGPILVTALRVGVSAEERRTAALGAVAPLIAELGTIEVPPGQSEATFTLRVPGRQ